MPSRDPRQRKSIATEAALLRWAREDGKAQAEKGQAGLRSKFEHVIRAEFPALPDDEIARRGDRLYRAHIVRIRRVRTLKTRAGGTAA